MATLSGRQMPEALHYVIWFNLQSTNYEPVAVFNAKEEAERYKIDFDNWLRERYPKTTLSAIVMQMSWMEFAAFAKNTTLPDSKPAQLVIDLPSTWTPAQIAAFKQEVASQLKSGAKEIDFKVTF